MPSLSLSTIRYLLDQGHSPERISREFNIPIDRVIAKLNRLGLMGKSSDVLKVPQVSDRSLKRYVEFSVRAKRKSFSASAGTCLICHELIGDGKNYELAVYHHKLPVYKGGNGSISNCMPLHETCHIMFFKKLHGIDYSPHFTKRQSR